ncbi:hypothetical protein GCM10018775_73700 [Streptomyces umbrinus]|nr:hypothetical protein GCM10018775_73700 [Streptomyces umbrinus]
MVVEVIVAHRCDTALMNIQGLRRVLARSGAQLSGRRSAPIVDGLTCEPNSKFVTRTQWVPGEFRPAISVGRANGRAYVLPVVEGPGTPPPWQNPVSLPGRAEPLRVPARWAGHGAVAMTVGLRMVRWRKSAVREGGVREEERVSG